MNKRIVIMLSVTLMLLAIPFASFQTTQVTTQIQPSSVQQTIPQTQGMKAPPSFKPLAPRSVVVTKTAPKLTAATSPSNNPQGVQPGWTSPSFTCPGTISAWEVGIPAGSTCFDGAGDPSAAIAGAGDFDAGTLFMGSLGFYDGFNPIPAGHAGDNGVFVFRSTNHGVTWTPVPVYVDSAPCCIGGAAPRFNDKDWITVDNGAASPNKGAVYVVWARFGEAPASPVGGSPIRFGFSFTGGLSYGHFTAPISAQPGPVGFQCTAPVGNLTDECPDNQFADVRTGTDGTIYVTWVNYDTPDQTQLIFERSINPITGIPGPVELVASVPFPVSSTRDFRGNEIGGLADQRERINTYPKLAVDTSGATTPNALYVVYEAFPGIGSYLNLGPLGDFAAFGTGPSCVFPATLNCVGRGSQIYAQVSLDGGLSWHPLVDFGSEPLSNSNTVDNSYLLGPNDCSVLASPSTCDRFNPSISIDPTVAGGAIHVIWYDTFNDLSSSLPGESQHNKLLDVMHRTSTGPAVFDAVGCGGGGCYDITYATGPTAIQIDLLTTPPLINLDEDIQRIGRGNFAGDYIQVAANHAQVYAGWTDTRYFIGADGFNKEQNILDRVNTATAIVFNNDNGPGTALEQNEETVAVGDRTTIFGPLSCDVLGGTNDYRDSFGPLFAGIGTGFSVFNTVTACGAAPVVTHSNVLFPFDPFTIPPPPVSTITVNLRLLTYKTVNVLIQVCTTAACTVVVTSTTVTLTPPNTASNTATRVFSVAPGTYYVKISGFSITTQTSGALTVPPPATVSFLVH
jgi:hypothetical protein